MPNKRTFIWITAVILLIGILCTVVWLLPDHPDEEEPSDLPPQVLFDSNDPDSVTALSFVYSKRSELSFLRTEVGWQAEGHPNLTVSDSAINALLDKLAYMLALRTVTESCADPAEYGFDQPICRITLTADGVEKCYYFGQYSEYYDGYYCMIDGQTAVYMVEASYAEQFDLTMEDLLGSDYLPDLNELQSVVWQVDGEEAITALPDGAHSELLSLLASLELGKWIDFGSEQYPIFGLDHPTVATLTLWDDATLTLSFGMGESDEFIYLRVGESELIYLADCGDLALLGRYVSGNI